MSSLDLSIIIVTWNNEKEILECLNSIYTETNNYTFEIIVVDNDSKDLTRKIILEKYPEVILINSHENLGFAKANNLGLRHAVGQYVLYLNPDTILLDCAIDKIMECATISGSKNYGIIACKLLNIDKSVQASVFKFLRLDVIVLEQFNLQNYLKKTLGKLYGYYGSSSRVIDWCIGALMLIKREDAIKIGGFSDDYFMYMEDLDICYKVKNHLKKEVFFLSTAECIHLGGASEKQNYQTKRSFKIFDSLFKFLEKYMPEQKIFYVNIYIRCYQIKKAICKCAQLFWRNDRLAKLMIKYNMNINYLKEKLNNS